MNKGVSLNRAGNDPPQPARNRCRKDLTGAQLARGPAIAYRLGMPWRDDQEEPRRGSWEQPLQIRTLICDQGGNRQLAVIEGAFWPPQHSTIEIPGPLPRDARVLGTRLIIDPPSTAKYATVLVDVEFLEGLVERPPGD